MKNYTYYLSSLIALSASGWYNGVYRAALESEVYDRADYDIKCTKKYLSIMKIVVQILSICLFTTATLQAQTAKSVSNTPQTVLTDQAATVLFAAGKAELTAVAKESLKTLLAQKRPYYEVSGYSDAHGDSLKNVLLSQQRAQVVADFLMTQGIDNQAIIVNYFGASQTKNSKKQDKNANLKNPNDRKVEIVAFSKLLTSWKEMVEKPQVFMITNKRDTVLTGKKGTIIKLPANCLSADPTKPIKMVLKEYYGQYDMLMNNMATLADGKLLESSGMLFLAAEQNGKPLTATKPLTYQFPNQDKNGNTDYNLYKGVKTAQGVNWKLTDVSANNTKLKTINSPTITSKTGAIGLLENRTMGTGEAQSMGGLFGSDALGQVIQDFDYQAFGYNVNVGVFEISQAECDGEKTGKAYKTNIGNSIYSGSEAKSAKFAVVCDDNKNQDTRELMQVFTETCDNRFQDVFFEKLDRDTKIKFFLNEACGIENFKISSKTKYVDSVLNESIKNWKNNRVFNKSKQFKNKSITIYIKTTDDACEEARKYYSALFNNRDSMMAVNKMKREIYQKKQDSIYKIKSNQIKEQMNNIDNSIADADVVSKKTADTYFKYASQNLGYINCDRFANIPNLTDFVVNTNTVENEQKPSIQVILKNKKSMIMAYCIKDSNGRFEIKGVPKNEPVYVIALTEKDGKAYMDMQETRVGNAPLTMNTTLATPTKLKQMRSLLE